MCGYIAIFKQDLNNLDKVMDNEILSHRGPDEKGFLVKDNFALGFWRLSIVDIKKGNQPMEDKSTGIKILFNGEIYNYKKIKNKLKNKKHIFESKSDTEVVLKAYVEWGLSCFNYFEGMFSICIIDSKKDKIHIARDRLGVKPLYYSYNKNELIIASEQKAILKITKSTPYINKNSLEDYFLFQSILGKNTLFKNINKVKKGEILSFNLKNQKLISSQNIVPEKKEQKIDTYNDYKSYVRGLVLNETYDALNTDLDITFQLSGGIDSNLMLAIAKHYFPDKHFYSVSSVVKDNFDDNELRYIKQSVDYFKTEHKIIEIDADLFFDNLDDSIEFLDEPTGDAGVVAQFIVNDKISDYSKIGIAGQGADELFFGYMRNFLTYIFSNNKNNLLESNFFIGWENFIKTFYENSSKQSNLTYYNKMVRFNPNKESSKEVLSLHNKFRSRKNEIYKNIISSSPSLNSFMVNSEIELQLQALLQMEDRASMRYSVETRVPLCTSSILESSYLGSIDWKFHNNLPKGILRDAFSDLIPSHILKRKKKVGRPLPLKLWLKENQKGRRYLDLLTKNKELINSLFDVNLYDYAINHPNTYDRTTWAILSLVLWIKKYKVSI